MCRLLVAAVLFGVVLLASQTRVSADSSAGTDSCAQPLCLGLAIVWSPDGGGTLTITVIAHDHAGHPVQYVDVTGTLKAVLTGATTQLVPAWTEQNGSPWTDANGRLVLAQLPWTIRAPIVVAVGAYLWSQSATATFAGIVGPQETAP